MSEKKTEYSFRDTSIINQDIEMTNSFCERNSICWIEYRDSSILSDEMIDSLRAFRSNNVFSINEDNSCVTLYIKYNIQGKEYFFGICNNYSLDEQFIGLYKFRVSQGIWITSEHIKNSQVEMINDLFKQTVVLDFQNLFPKIDFFLYQQKSTKLKAEALTND